MELPVRRHGVVCKDRSLPSAAASHAEWPLGHIEVAIIGTQEATSADRARRGGVERECRTVMWRAGRRKKREWG